MNRRDDDEDRGLDSDEMSDTPSELELIGHTTASGGEVRVKGRKRSIFRKIRRHSQTVYRKCRVSTYVKVLEVTYVCVS